MANLYSDLPGVNLTLADGGLSQSQIVQAANTETVLIIAPTGVVDTDPYVIDDLALTWIKDQTIFGDNSKLGAYAIDEDITKDNRIAKMWKQATDAGCQSVYGVPLRGETTEEKYIYLHDLYTALEDNTVADLVVVDGIWGDDKVTIKSIDIPEDGTIEFATTGLYLIKESPLGKTQATVTGNATVGNIYAGQLVNVTNVLPLPVIVTGAATTVASAIITKAGHSLVNGDKVEISAVTTTGLVAGQYFVVASTATTFGLSLTSGGAAISATAIGTLSYIKVLPEAVTINMTSQFYDRKLFNQDLNPLFNVLIEGTSTDIAGQLAGYCKVASDNSKQILGVMSVAAPTEASIVGIRTYIKKFEAPNKLTYNGYVQLIGGPELQFIFNGALYSDVWTGAYAGLISSLKSYSSPTNKRIPGAMNCAYKLSRNQQLTLINAHIVPAKVRGLGDIAVADAITTAMDNSDFVRLTTLRITKDAVELIRNISDPYIGEPNSMEKRNALEAQVRAGLSKMVQAGAIQKFNLIFKASAEDIIKGDMRIFLEFVPQFETRNIRLSVSLKASI